MKIIVAEGQDIFRKLIVSCLEEKHFFVLQASDRKNLEQLLKQEVNLLILDTALVFGDIGAYMASLRKVSQGLEIILMVNQDSSTEAVQALTHGALDCLAKPFTVEKLISSVEKAFPQDRAIKKDEEEIDSRGCLILESLPSVHKHPLMKKALGLLTNVAESNITVLLSGPSGVGKEMFARTLHTRSKRLHHNFVGLNCASVPESLLEAELFGSERGAYTGSVSQRVGKFELAQKGTLLLDEVSEMNVSLQSKLLRVIQEKEMYRIGGDRSIPLDVRIIATTNRDLYEWVKKGLFREDLFYRLNVISIEVPPLCERIEDVPVLAEHIMERFNKDYKEKNHKLTTEAIQQLCQYNWLGNIRELENVLIRTIFMTSDRNITQIYFDERKQSTTVLSSQAVPLLAQGGEKVRKLEEMEYDMIRMALEQCDGNRTHAATVLGISVRTLRNKLQTYPELSRNGLGAVNLDDSKKTIAAC